MKIPYVYVSFCEDDERKGRWDQRWVQRLLDQSEWKPPGGYEFYEYDTDLGDPAGPMEGCIIIFPAGHYRYHCSGWPALARLQRLVDSLPWSVVIATSDEQSWFPWARFNPPDNCRLWVMTPRPEKSYPPGTFFIGEGSPWSPEEIAAHALPNWEKTTDLFFSGQINHERRIKMIVGVEKTMEEGWSVERHATEGFRQGMSTEDYLSWMTRSRVIPCASGRGTQDSFRFYEALEAQAEPVADNWRNRTKHPGGYWEMLYPDYFPFGITDWNELPDRVRHVKRARALPAQTSAWWQQQKRNVAYKLQADVTAARDWHGLREPVVTAVIVTSPSPLHPSIDMIMETLHSVRDRLPNVEILIGIDGLRPDDGRDSYYEYARRLCAEVNPMRNICPFVFTEHLHQSGMMMKLMGEYDSRYTLFMEHDTPLVGEIDFEQCVSLMDEHHLSALRFHYADFIAPEHASMFLELQSKKKFLRTIQYSARPHLVNTDTLDWWLSAYFGSSKTFLEDTLHSVLAHPTEAETQMERQVRLASIWGRNRLAVYNPGGSMRRSAHLDGRRGEEKRPTWIQYDGPTPPGCPVPGVMKV
jgi:hypothetical protein